MLAGQTPVVYEDGRQLRDFVHVSDIVQACCLAMTRSEADYQVLNVGTGRPISVMQVGELLARQLGWTGGFEVRHKFRAGDIRHCFANIARIQTLLGYAPRYRFEDGVPELVAWVARQRGLSLPEAGEVERQLEDYGLLR
jgi:dTDP-L-rhamnose 4-epimerase